MELSNYATLEPKQADMEEGKLKEALGNYYKIYVEFAADRHKIEKERVEQLKKDNNSLKRMNERLVKQISETKSQAPMVRFSM